MSLSRWSTLAASFLATLILGSASVAQAATHSCTARVALNRVYDVTLDTTSGDVSVRNDAGTTINGRAAVTVSGRTGNTILFVPTSFSQGIELEVEAGGTGRIAMCLAANQCYLCD